MTGKVIDEVNGARAGGRPSDCASVALDGERTGLAEERDMLTMTNVTFRVGEDTTPGEIT